MNGVRIMNRAMLKQYTKLVEFLGLVLGPTYEITLIPPHRHGPAGGGGQRQGG